MDMALASKSFPPSSATAEQPISKREKTVANDSSSKNTYLNPKANDVSFLFILLIIIIAISFRLIIVFLYNTQM
jgi:hypothetical protein